MKVSLKDCLKVCGSIFVLYLCIRYWQSAAEAFKLVLGASTPLIIGCCIAYVVNILMSFYERLFFPKTGGILGKFRRPVCMGGAFVSLVAVVGLVIRLVLPQLVSCFGIIAAALPEFMKQVVTMVDESGLLSEETLATLQAVDWKNWLSQLLQVLRSGIGSVMDVVVTTVSSVFSGVVTALVAVIFSVYLLGEKENLGAQFHMVTRRYLPKGWYRSMCYVLDVVNDCFHRYIVGQCIEAVILGILCAVGMALLRLPYATMIGALVAFTALIPVAGAYIGAGVGAFMILMVDPVKSVVFLVFLVVLQQLEGNLIYPRVVGSSMGLPGIWVLAAVTVGGGVLGIAGMFLGVPLAAAAYRIIRDDVKRGSRKQKRQPETVSAPAKPEQAEIPAQQAPASGEKPRNRQKNRGKRK